jgi:predicted DNA-binding antitoxin AbrB/MazE fold protein
LQQVPFREGKKAKKASEEAGEIFNICTKLAAFLEKKEQAKKASEEATESLEHLYSTCSKFPSEN